MMFLPNLATSTVQTLFDLSFAFGRPGGKKLFGLDFSLSLSLSFAPRCLLSPLHLLARPIHQRSYLGLVNSSRPPLPPRTSP